MTFESSIFRASFALLLVALIQPLVATIHAQQTIDQRSPQSATNVDEGSLRLQVQGEISLADFVDYVAQRLELRVTYDPSVRRKEINLIAPDPIPIGSLSDILQSVLVNEGLIITEPDSQGLRRITTNDQIPLVARPSTSDEKLSGLGDAVPITRIFVLQQTKPTTMVQFLTPFLSVSGASMIPIDRSGLLLITDIVRNIRRAEQLIRILDGEKSQVDVEFVAAKNVEVSILASQLQSIVSARSQAIGQTGEINGGLQISTDQRTNSLILIGRPEEIEVALSLLESLDTSLETQQQTFTLRFYSAEAFDMLIRSLIEARPLKPPYTSRIEGSSVIVDSTPEILALIDRTRSQLDTREAPEAQSPIRYYRIRNLPASELLLTIQGIGANVSSIPVRQERPNRRRTTNDFAVPGPNQFPVAFGGIAQPTRIPPLPAAFRETLGGNDFDASADTRVAQQERPVVVDVQQFSGDAGGELSRGLPDDLFPSEEDERPQTIGDQLAQASVTADLHTNTIIVVASPEVQRVYASLIERLDQRRPQVLIEAQIAIIDTSDDFTLGVEISGGDRLGARRLFNFSSFGLSTVDPTDGSLAIIPGVGFNGTLVDPSTADVVVRALTNHRRAKVLSTPRILVNDNAEGQLTSVMEVPFTSINASQTVATTSFAGFAEAGTTVTVTPTISDDDYIQLDYAVTLNSFTGVGTDGVPPPRQTNEVSSRVTVPNGYTVIVGGLKSSNSAYEIDGIPILDRIPIIRELSSLQQINESQTSLFVFLKPVVLCEDKFKDLRYISDLELRKADLPLNFPTDPPLMVR